MVRPEALHLGDRGTAPVAAVRGRAIQSSFLGTRVRVAIETGCSRAPLMASLHGDLAAAPAADTDVAVWWLPEEAIVLPVADAS